MTSVVLTFVRISLTRRHREDPIEFVNASNAMRFPAAKFTEDPFATMTKEGERLQIDHRR